MTLNGFEVCLSNYCGVPGKFLGEGHHYFFLRGREGGIDAGIEERAVEGGRGG